MNATRIIARCVDCGASVETHAGGHAHLCDDCRRERRNGRNLTAWHMRNTQQPERFRVLHDETGSFRPGAQFGLCDFRYCDVTIWKGVEFEDTKTGRVVTAWQIVERMA